MFGNKNCKNCTCATKNEVTPVSGPMVGSMLPDITLDAYLASDDVQKISLSDYRGKWLVLFFYPADFTFVCPTELEDMADNYAAFQKEGAEILAISTDGVYVHKAWRDASDAIKKIQFPMLSDRCAVLSSALGVHIHEEGVALRGSFIVNPEGCIVAMEVNSDAIGRNATELLRKVRAAKYTAEHPGNVCPAKWEPGSDTLKPGLDLVGKI